MSLIKRDDCLNNKFLESFKHVKTFCTNNNKKTDESGITVEIKDSGSGIYIKKDENYFIGGIISKASPADNMVVFTNVYQYLYWIESHCKTY